jgi:hypothetical protein
LRDKESPRSPLTTLFFFVALLFLASFFFTASSVRTVSAQTFQLVPISGMTYRYWNQSWLGLSYIPTKDSGSVWTSTSGPTEQHGSPPSLVGISPDKSGTIPDISYINYPVDFYPFGSPINDNGHSFSARWTGSLDIKTTGSYTFKLTADDEAWLWLENEEGTWVITGQDLGGGAYYPGISYTTNLGVGQYAINVDYFEYTPSGGSANGGINLTYTGPPEAMINTALSSSTIIVGGSVTDWATITGLVNPTDTGSINFYTYSDSGCSMNQTPEGSIGSISANGVYGPSNSVTYTKAGTYYWNAVFTGDANNNGATSKCERLKVTKAPTLTTISCSMSSVEVKEKITCTVTVSGYSPTGKVTWSKVSGTGKVGFSPNPCYLSSESCSVTVMGLKQGSVTIEATYSGDPNNLVGSQVYHLTVWYP